MQSIGLGEALSLWFSGQKLDNVSFGGISVVWWARAAKIATYMAELTIVFDLIGTDTLRDIGESALHTWKKFDPSQPKRIIPVSGFVGGVVGLAAYGEASWEDAARVLGFVGVVVAIPGLALGFIALLRNPNWVYRVRVTAVVIVSASFTVDLLTS